jgi:hypothetical protein
MIEHVFEQQAPSREPPLRAPTPAAPARRRSPSGATGVGGPPGWPPGVPPPGERGWENRATAWLLDHCPPDYRLYAAWRRHPVALGWLAVRHLDAQLEAMRSAYREIRVELVGDIGPEGVTQVLADLECEGVRLVAARRAAGLLLDALRGLEFVPRL